MINWERCVEKTFSTDLQQSYCSISGMFISSFQQPCVNILYNSINSKKSRLGKMEWKGKPKDGNRWKSLGLSRRGKLEGGVANKGAGNPAKTEARGIFPAKTAALQGEDGKNRLQNREKWLWNREKTIFSIDNFAPCRLYCYLARFRPERRVF